MSKNLLALRVGIAIASVAFIGCVSVHRVTIKDAPRRSVAFESARAMQLFYDALLREHLPKVHKPSRVKIGNTLYTSEARVSANLAFNDGVVVADRDGNGVISEHEANTYASFKVE